MAIGDRKIVLTKSEDLASFVIIMGAVLDDASSKKEFTIKDNTAYRKDKPVEEIFDFKWDYKKIVHDYLDFIDDHKRLHWELSVEEKNLFLKSAHAAYYFLQESTIPNDIFYKNYYKEYFQNR